MSKLSLRSAIVGALALASAVVFSAAPGYSQAADQTDSAPVGVDSATDGVTIKPVVVRESDNGGTISVTAENVVMVFLDNGDNANWSLARNHGDVLDEGHISRFNAMEPTPERSSHMVGFFMTQGVGTTELEFVCKDNAGNVVKTVKFFINLPLTPDVAE